MLRNGGYPEELSALPHFGFDFVFGTPINPDVAKHFVRSASKTASAAAATERVVLCCSFTAVELYPMTPLTRLIEDVAAIVVEELSFDEIIVLDEAVMLDEVVEVDDES